jgi:hypothetical protein
MIPAAVLKKMPRQILNVKALHHEDNAVLNLVVKAGKQSCAAPFDCLIARSLGHCVGGLYRIVNDDKIAASAGQRAADRRLSRQSPKAAT